MTFGAASGDAGCPDLTAQQATYVYVVTTSGVTGTVPRNSTPAPENVFDENTCTAHLRFDSTSGPVAGCTVIDSYMFDLAFDATGFTGTYAFHGCGNVSEGGTAVETLQCTYPLTARTQ